jgi:hypothetical protein
MAFQPIRQHNRPQTHWLERVFYEFKPFLYFGCALLVLKAPTDYSTLVKAAALGVAVFCAYALYGRLQNRGFLN